MSGGGPPSGPAAPSARAWRTLLWLVAAPLLGVACGYWLLVEVVLEHADLGDRQRIVELARHLDRHVRDSRPWLVFVGASITRDGIDAGIVESAAPEGWRVENLGLSGCGNNERLVLLPRLLAKGPARIVVGIFPTNLWGVDALPSDKATVYAWAGFVAAWPEGTTRADFPGIETETWAALRASRLAQQLELRTTLIEWLENSLRFRLRKDLRSGDAADWIRPYTRLSSIGGERLAVHLAAVRAEMSLKQGTGTASGSAALARMAASARAAGATPSFLVLPIHPELRGLAASFLEPLPGIQAAVAAAAPADWLDARDLLAADEFADALHPNATGREKLSRWVGRRLPAP